MQALPKRIANERQALDALAYFGLDLSKFTDRTRNGDLIYSTWTESCPRCGGAGYYPTPRHGACYECNGDPPKPVRRYRTVIEVARELAKRERKSQRDAEDRAAFRAELISDPSMAEADSLSTSIPFVADVLATVYSRRHISDRQRAALQKAVESHKAREANREAEEALKVPAPVTDERITITGEVLSVKPHDSQYGHTLRMTVKVSDDAGGFWLAWGTVPSALETMPVRGQRVTFTAKVTVSDRDPSFAFFKRPTKASVIAG
jgi:hypothetical protein